MKSISSSLYYGQWMGMIPLNVFFVICITLTQVNGMDQVESEQTQGLFLGTCIYQEMKWTSGPRRWLRRQRSWQRRCIYIHDSCLITCLHPMRGIFDEMGIFTAFCHHGFALITDMVQSGEQCMHCALV